MLLAFIQFKPVELGHLRSDVIETEVMHVLCLFVIGTPAEKAVFSSVCFLQMGNVQCCFLVGIGNCKGS